MEKVVSKYKNNILASKKQRIYARLLDYFSLFIVTYLLFTIFNAVANYTPAFVNIVDSLTEANYKAAEYIDSTRLQHFNEDKTGLVSIDSDALTYAKNVCKTSAYVHQLKFPVKQDDGSFIDTDVTIEETFIYQKENCKLDNLSYYYFSFKKRTESLNDYLYDGVDYKNDIETYQYLKIMNYESSIEKFVDTSDSDYESRGDNVSRYVVLTKDNTEKLLKYFRDDKLDTSIHKLVYEGYIKGAQYGIKDVENNSNDYKAIIDEFNALYQRLSGAVFLVYLISYTIGFILLIGILRLIKKDWITLGQSVLGLAIADGDEMSTPLWKILLYHLLNFVMGFSSAILAFYFTGMFGVLSFKLIGGFTLFALLIAILVLDIFSLFMPLFNKNNHDLETFIMRINVKDTREFEGPIVDDLLENSDSGENDGSNSGESK